MFFQELSFGCGHETCTFETNDGDAYYGHYYGHILDHHEEEVFLGNLSVIYARNVHKKANFEMTHENNLNLTVWRQLAS